MSEHDFEATRSFLLNYSKLWVQTLAAASATRWRAPSTAATTSSPRSQRPAAETDRRAGQRRRPQVPQAPGMYVAIVARDAESLKSQLTSGEPTPITYDTAGHPRGDPRRGQGHREVPLGEGPGRDRAGGADVREVEEEVGWVSLAPARRNPPRRLSCEDASKVRPCPNIVAGSCREGPTSSRSSPRDVLRSSEIPSRPTGWASRCVECGGNTPSRRSRSSCCATICIASGPSPYGDDRFDRRWKWIKAAFTEHWLAAGGDERSRSPSRLARGERGIWQRRYWEHLIRDEEDLERHVDYIHFNPIKHGLVTRPGDWPWSSYHRYVRLGRYPADWGATTPQPPRTPPPE